MSSAEKNEKLNERQRAAKWVQGERATEHNATEQTYLILLLGPQFVYWEHLPKFVQIVIPQNDWFHYDWFY